MSGPSVKHVDNEEEEEDEQTVECKLCKTQVVASKMLTHRAQTCHLLAQMEIEGKGNQPIIYAFSEKDVGYRMLQQQGWSHGEALGVLDDANTGLKVPVAPKIKSDKAGLGSVKSTGIGILKRVGDTFRKTPADQLDAIKKRQKKRDKSGSIRKSHKELLRDVEQERKK
ncbi:UNVERIFIED_CONTAM: hypothetical protein HDU68_006027, partial [Siphonaria sp. JEL0065]